MKELPTRRITFPHWLLFDICNNYIINFGTPDAFALGVAVCQELAISCIATLDHQMEEPSDEVQKSSNRI